MKLREFLEKFQAEALERAKEIFWNLPAELDPTELNRRRSSFEGTFMLECWDSLLDNLDTSEDPKELSTTTCNDLQKQGYGIRLGFEAGEANTTLALQQCVFSLCGLIIGAALERGSRGQREIEYGFTSELTLIESIARQTTSRDITTEEENRLRRGITHSIIDIQSAIKYLRDPKSGPERVIVNTGQYL